ncbi:MAG: DEAD/DEAH box helicase, partial [Kiritimatiellae bacterium]|nr:DEAD/DEAH box helicase [Kiritimatiellia bacterium]
SLVVRLSSPDPDASRHPIVDALRDLFAAPADPESARNVAGKRNTVAHKLQEVAEAKNAFSDAQAVFGEIESLSQELETLRNTPYARFLDAPPDLPPENAIAAARRILARLAPLPASPWLAHPAVLLRWLTLRPLLAHLRGTTYALALAFDNDTKLRQRTVWNFLKRLDEVRDRMDDWGAAAQVVQKGRRLAEMRRRWEGTPTLPAIEETLHKRRQASQVAAKQCLCEIARSRGCDFDTPAEREAMDQLRATVAQDARGGGDSRSNRLSPEHYRYLTKHLPLWATTTLSVGRHLPLRAGMFDLLVVDEASQCDIASVVPLLFRCRRLLAVGDPQQLRFVSRLKPADEDRLRHRSGTSNPDPFDRFRYRDRSFYELASTSRALPARGPIGLREHFRCDPEIATYFNTQFYRERLIVLTTPNRCDGIAGPHGIRWTDCNPDGCAAKGGGAWSPEQARLIVAELFRLADGGFCGTVGVVTPFREQARRIADAIEQTGKRNLLPAAWDLRVDTADGFQGGERDLMLFSLVGGPDMPKGALWFYEDDPNRFNVAVSRARKVLHVFGPRQWLREWTAGEPGRKHLAALLAADEAAPPARTS